MLICQKCQSVSVLCVSASFKGDLHLWCRLLLPGAVKRVYNLQSKQLIKLFSKVSDTAMVQGFIATEIWLCMPFRCNPVHMSWSFHTTHINWHASIPTCTSAGQLHQYFSIIIILMWILSPEVATSFTCQVKWSSFECIFSWRHCCSCL
jgi:hypothetical protein